MRTLFLLLGCLSCLFGCGQKTNKQVVQKEIKVGGRCEGCEAIYESPFETLNETDTLPDFNEPGPKIEISGIIFQKDGKTPAPGIILYVYHTDQKGIYAKRGNETGWAKQHGYIRGWMKTDKNGFYRFYTLIPASYPNSTNPKHIHPTIKEPGYSEYWIDDFVFLDDPLLPASEKTKTHPVGGSGVLRPAPADTVTKDGILRATRNIILGQNVQDYFK
jgi:protocatechuate 3,4-dioxygenase, beta subunit